MVGEEWSRFEAMTGGSVDLKGVWLGVGRGWYW